MMKRTVLFQQHIKAKARMVEFCGWEMPIHYGSQIDEHHYVRQNAGVFDVSHMLAVDISGNDAPAFLAYLLANDIRKISMGKAMYSCMLNEAGGILDDLIVYHVNTNAFRVIINAGNREDDTRWIKKQAQHYDVNIAEREDLAILAVQGPRSSEKLQQALPKNYSALTNNLSYFSVVNKDQWMIARTGYTGEDGYELILPKTEAVALWQNLLAYDIKPCGLGARDTLRLEAGMNLYGSDMTEAFTPYETGLAWTVRLSDDRNFVGKEALLSQKQQGVPRKLVGVMLEAKGVLRQDQTVLDQNNNRGKITSGTFSPSIKKSIAFASVPQDAATLAVIIRDKKLPLRVVKYPFVRKGKILVN
ncbi:MAG: glycine cleavage system aminomethyltransferase GcvT [Pseudomonadota bacterium]